MWAVAPDAAAGAERVTAKDVGVDGVAESWGDNVYRAAVVTVTAAAGVSAAATARRSSLPCPGPPDAATRV